MPLDPALVARVKGTFASLSSEELRGILTAHDQSQWSDEAFEAARQVLEERAKGDVREPASLSPADDFWQDGELVVLRATATFPPRCVRCNKPTGELHVPVVRDASGGVVQCPVCPSHVRSSRIAAYVCRWSLVIAAGALVWLASLLDNAEGGRHGRVALTVCALGLLILCRFVWGWVSRQMKAGGFFPVQWQILKVGCFVVVLLGAFAIWGATAVATNWKPHFLPPVLMGTGALAIALVARFAFTLRLSLAGSHPGFLVLWGAGSPFRDSLPAWPGVPRTARVTSPRDVGDSGR